MARVFSQKEYQIMVEEGDGICSCCYSVSMGNADPLSENTYCSECENRTVHGMKAAKQKGLITIL